MQTIKDVLLAVFALVSGIVGFLFFAKSNKKPSSPLQNDDASATIAQNLQSEINTLKEEIETTQANPNLSPKEVEDYWRKNL
jgi:hypothetical protein